jgi:hypothetical protein
MILFRTLIAFMLTIACFSANAQFVTERTIQTKALGIEVSELDQVYLQFSQRIELLDENWNVRYSFSERRLSANTGLDVTKSLKPLVYFEEFNLGVLLDNTLSQQSSELIFDWNRFGQVGALCHSIGNHYWIFDVAAMQLIRADYSLKEVQRTADLSLLLGVSLDPVYMVEEEDYLYVLDKEQGLYIFDLFGTFSHRLDFTGFHALQIIEQHIYLFSSDQVVSYNKLTKVQTSVKLPYDNILDVRILGSSFLVLRKGELIQIRQAKKD